MIIAFVSTQIREQNTVPGKVDMVGGEVPVMKNAVGGEGLEGGGDLPENVLDEGFGEGGGVEAVVGGKGASFDVLEGEEAGVGVFGDFLDYV